MKAVFYTEHAVFPLKLKKNQKKNLCANCLLPCTLSVMLLRSYILVLALYTNCEAYNYRHADC